MLTADDVELWHCTVPGDAVPVRVALMPDIDGDHFREIRVRFAPTVGHEAFTWIISGLTGRALFEITSQGPFDPWRDLKGDLNGDGEVTMADWLDLVAQPLRSRPTIFQARSHWRVIRSGPLPSNVTPVLRRHSGNWTQNATAGSGVGIDAPTAIQVNYVAFFQNGHKVHRDIGLQLAYSKIWLDSNGDGDADDWSTGDIRAPLAYTINDQIKATPARFTVTGSIDTGSTISVVGKVGGQTVLTSTNPTLNGNEITAVMTGSVSTGTTIEYWADWAIEWVVTITPQGPGEDPIPYAAGSTTNDVYIVLEDPTANGQNANKYLWYLTPLHIGCSKADGEDGMDETAIVDKVWSAFDRGGVGYEALVRRTEVLEGVADPMTLAYYRNWKTPFTKLGDFLKDPGTNGQCQAWTSLFLRTLHILGIEPGGPSAVREIKEDKLPLLDGRARVLFIKDWNKTGSSLPEDQEDLQNLGYEAINIPILPPPPPPQLTPDWFYGATSYHTWLFSDLDDQTGIEAQAMANPLSVFFFHQIVEINDVLYDPSYGVTYGDLVQMETDVIEAYGIFYFLTRLELDEADFGDLNGNTSENEEDVPTRCFVLMTDLSLSKLKADPMPLGR